MDERRRRWRLVLGDADGEEPDSPLTPEDAAVDRALAALYEPEREGGLQRSSPYVARWLGDIRRWFPPSVVRVLQRDAVERLGLTSLLLDPELLESIEPDVHLVATLLSLSDVIPDETRATARQVVRRLVEALQKALRRPFVQSVRGAVDRASRRRRPRGGDVDWDRTIRANLEHWLPEHKLLIPERIFARGRHTSALHDVILCLDQSGSMAPSLVYAAVYGAALASLPAVRTRFVAFDTEVVDLTEAVHDPVDLLFGAQLGGGTDIGRALAWCETLVERPQRTVLVLVSDLFEGGDAQRMVERATALVDAGVTVVALLALDDAGAPAWSARHAAALANLGIPVFACTPDHFPGLMAAALEGRDLKAWMGRAGIRGV